MELIHGWHGITKTGGKVSIPPLKMTDWVIYHRPEWLPQEDNLLGWYWPELFLVFTKADALMQGAPELEDMLLVTVKPPEVDTYSKSAYAAAEKDPANEARWLDFAKKLEDAGM
jgi:hypothetical protein